MFGQVMWTHWKPSIIRAGESAREGRSLHSVTEATLQASHITNHPESKHQNKKTHLFDTSFSVLPTSQEANIKFYVIGGIRALLSVSLIPFY